MSDDTGKATDGSSYLSRIRSLLVISTAAGSAILSIISSPNGLTAGLMLVTIVTVAGFIMWVLRILDKQDAKHVACEARVNDLHQALHRRDIALAVLYNQAQELTGGKRRKTITPLEELLGDDGKVALNEARRVVRNVAA